MKGGFSVPIPQSYCDHCFNMTLFLVILLLLSAIIRIEGNTREILSCQDLSATNTSDFENEKSVVLKAILPRRSTEIRVRGPNPMFLCYFYDESIVYKTMSCEILYCDNVTIVAAFIPNFQYNHTGIWDFEIPYIELPGGKISEYRRILQIEAYETKYVERYHNKKIDVRNGEYIVMIPKEMDSGNLNCTLINEGTNERYNLSDVAFRFPENRANIIKEDPCGFRMLVGKETQGNWSLVQESGWKRHKARFAVDVNSSIVRNRIQPIMDKLYDKVEKVLWFEGYEATFPFSRDSFSIEIVELENPSGDIIRPPKLSDQNIYIGPLSHEDGGKWKIRFENESNVAILREGYLSVDVPVFPDVYDIFDGAIWEIKFFSDKWPITCTMKYNNESLSDCKIKRDESRKEYRIRIADGIIEGIDTTEKYELSMDHVILRLNILSVRRNADRETAKYAWHSRQMQKYVNRGETLKIRCLSNYDDSEYSEGTLKKCSLVSPQGTMYIQGESPFVSEYKSYISKEIGCKATLENVEDKHNGTWTCSMDYGNGLELQSLVPVRVTESDLIPRIDQTDRTVYLQCQLSPGKRFRKIVLCEWFHGNDSFKEDSTNYTVSTNDKNCNLEVKNPSENDVGVWKCCVRLDIGGERNATVEFQEIFKTEKELDGKREIDIPNRVTNQSEVKRVMVESDGGKLSDFPDQRKQNRTTNNIRNKNLNNDTASAEQPSVNIFDSRILLLLIIILSISIVFLSVLIYYCTIGKKHWKQKVIDKETGSQMPYEISDSPPNSAEQVIEEEKEPQIPNEVSGGPSNSAEQAIEKEREPQIPNEIASPPNLAEQVIEEETAPRFLQRISPVLPTLVELLHQDDHILPYIEDKWEFPFTNLFICGDLGGGNFGDVVNARAVNILGDGQRTIVAAKTINMFSFSTMRALAIELRILANLDKHPNIIDFLGACTRNVPEGRIWIILERCRHGSLYAYIEKHKSKFTNKIEIVICGKRDPRLGELDYEDLVDTLESSNNTGASEYYGLDADGNVRTPKLSHNKSLDSQDFVRNNEEVPRSKEPRPFSTGDLLTWSSQVAHGMEFLSQKGILHGDLAARNVLLSDNRIAKICDFGLARSIPKSIGYYHNEINEDLPILNSAIEVMEEKKFSTESDVWSFGIFIWELLSLRKTPYSGLLEAMNKRTLLKLLKRGDRLEKPPYATERTYRMMRHCWEEEPNDRPSFSELIDELKKIIDEKLICEPLNSE